VSRLVARAVGIVAVALTLAFLMLPLLAILLRVPPLEIVERLGSRTALEALRVTLVTSVVAHAIVLAVGTPCAYALARRRFRGRGLVVTVIELPLVLPPAVAGIGLLAAFGARGVLGGALEVAGVRVAFTPAAVVMAIVFVSSPFYVRAGIAAFEGVGQDALDAARTLGAGPLRVFWRVALPLAAGGLGAGSTLAFARGLGEFGATILFAGSLAGVTQTLSLAIYAELDRDLDTALAIGALLVVVSIAILAAAKLLGTWTRSTSAFESR
jgi:molybdate transport system permease protein